MLTALCALGAGVAGLMLGYLSALYTHPKLRKRPPNSDEISSYMSKVVNLEELEEHQRQVKLNMLRAGKRTVRYDGGPNAKVVRMRKVNKRPRIKSKLV